jgi:UDP-N-acetylmuramyl pentapeptide phosphotransferase/UDP-N-acetylglucosamine-1-phosphate transferase
MYEDYRCVIFAVAGFFGYQWVDDILRKRRHSNTIAAAATALAALLTVLLYELAYTQGDCMGENAGMDLILTAAVIAATWVAKCIVNIISRDDAWNIM